MRTLGFFERLLEVTGGRDVRWFSTRTWAGVAEAKRGDTVALFSNGAFGRLHGRLLTALGERAAG